MEIDYNSFTNCPVCNEKIKTYRRVHLGSWTWYWCKKCKVNRKLYRYRLKNWYEVRRILMDDECYTVAGLSKIVDIPEATVRYYVYRGMLPFYEVNGHVRFRGKDLEYIKFFISEFHSLHGGRKAIRNGHTDKDVSRQRKFQLRKRDEKREVSNGNRKRKEKGT